MERVSHEAERNLLIFQKRKQPPKFFVQDGVAAGYVKIGNPLKLGTHAHALFQSLFHTGPIHTADRNMVVFRENVAMDAPLIAVIRNMPLKRKIFVHAAILAGCELPDPHQKVRAWADSRLLLVAAGSAL
jgi:hypothetical protein